MIFYFKNWWDNGFIANDKSSPFINSFNSEDVILRPWSVDVLLRAM